MNGNVSRAGFIYDHFDQLIEAADERAIYDALGRRIQKGNRSFLYLGNEEIGSFESNGPKELKIPGTTPIAIEIDQKLYIPIADVQQTIRLLIDPATGQIARRNDCDPFGRGLTDAIPYAYGGKRYDPKTGILYFGQRYYDPSLQRWLTPDPLGPLDHSNLYQYVFNNPFRYRDPSGQFAIPVFVWAIGGAAACPLTWGIAAAVGVGYVACWGLEKMIDQGSLQAGTTSYSLATGLVGFLSGSLINNYYDGTLLSKTNEIRTSPPYDGRELGTNPATAPAKEFEWKGRGKPGSRQGSWYNPLTGESLHPDLDHPAPIKPHWDYEGPNGEKARLNTDGTWEWK